MDELAGRLRTVLEHDGPDGPPGDLVSDLLADMRDASLPPSAAARLILEILGEEVAPALVPAVLSVARAADLSSRRNGYHNPVHFREVGVLFALLWRIERRVAGMPVIAGSDAARSLAVGLAAAFGHDLEHDGGGNVVFLPGPDGTRAQQAVPLRLERKAAAAVVGHLRDAGARVAELDAARAIVLATDVELGYRQLAAALDLEPPPPPIAEPGFQALADRGTARVAALVRDADLFASAALRPADHDLRTHFLEDELGLPRSSLGATGSAHFLERIVGRFMSPAAARYDAAFATLVALNRRRLDEPALAGMSLAETAAAPPARATASAAR